MYLKEDVKKQKRNIEEELIEFEIINFFII